MPNSNDSYQRIRRHLRSILASVVALAVSTALAPIALAFRHHLSPEDVREAYFIGRDLERREAFFETYMRSPHPAGAGPNIQIEFRTPYEQVAYRARDAADDYFPPDAAQDYLEHPIHEIIVRALIYESATFSFPYAKNPSSELLARLFKFRVSQDAHQIDSDKLTAEYAIPLGLGPYSSASLGGIDIQLHFDASQFKSDDPVTVEVLAPTGQTYTTTFDLTALK